MSIFRTLYTAMQCQGSQGSGVAPRMVYSIGHDRVVLRKALTPAV